MIQMNILIPKSLLTAVDAAAKKEGVQRAVFVRRVLAESIGIEPPSVKVGFQRLSKKERSRVAAMGGKAAALKCHLN